MEGCLFTLAQFYPNRLIDGIEFFQITSSVEFLAWVIDAARTGLGMVRTQELESRYTEALFLPRDLRPSDIDWIF